MNIFRRSVEAITRSLDRMVDDLIAHAEHHERKAERHDHERIVAILDADNARAEAAKARSIANNIAKLIEG